MAGNSAKVDILHPLSTQNWEHCRKWKDYIPSHCAVLHSRVAILTWKTESNDVLHISSIDLRSWTTTTLPYELMSLTTYKSQFVLVGGRDLSTKEPTDLVLTSDTGLKWQPSLPRMRTKRYYTSSLGTTSPEILIVAGGSVSYGMGLDDVEVLIEDNWHSVCSLPKPCYLMTSTLYQDEVVFTDRGSSSIYSCNITSLISSCTTTSTHTSPWRHFEAPGEGTTTISYSSRLVNIDEYCDIRGYSSVSQSWVEATSVGSKMPYSHPSAATLPTGNIVVARIDDGIYRVKVSVSSFERDREFTSNVLSRLEAVMGIQLVSVLANKTSQLTTSSGVELQTQYDVFGDEISLPDPQRDPVEYVNEVILQWSMRHSPRPPTWRQLLNVLQDIGLIELSQQIEAFMNGDDVYVDAYRHFISTKDILELLFLKFLFVGVPRQGKSTARRRFMGEIDDLESAGEADQPHASTGTVECGHDVIVKSLTDTTAVITGRQWSAVHSLTDEARMLFHNFVDSVQPQTDSAVQVSAVKETQPTKSAGEVTSATIVSTEHTATTATVSSTERKKQASAKLQPGLARKFFSKLKNLGRRSSVPAAISEITAIFNEVREQSELWKDVKHSFRAYLRMEDTGGQPELMDMLPALTIGPGLYLLFFSFECDLKSNFPVYYETSLGKTTKQEESAVTLEEMLLSSLSSISCSNSLANSMSLTEKGRSDMQDILESSKSVAYIVGTHRDKVSEEYVASFDQQLQQVIRDTDFFDKGVVQFFSESQLVVSMDNMKGGKDEVCEIRQVLEKAMEKHFKKLRIPAVWLLFSLCLRMKGVRTASMETCLELSRAFKMTPYETKVALWFLHHHAGVMMYFSNVSGLEDLVIIDIQVVYDSITSVILKAMSFDNKGMAAAERFRSTGQFSIRDLIAATADTLGDLIPTLKLVALLEYLHIVARIVTVASSMKSSEDRDDIYIMPCVLRSANKATLDAVSVDESRPMFIAPLKVRFVCGFVPIGVFPAMTASFIGNSSFKLIEAEVKKNLVQFHYGSSYALIRFLARPKSYEIVISQLPGGKHQPHILCAELRKEIEATFEKVSSRMNYGHFMDYQFGFDCPTHTEEDHVCVVDRQSSSPQAMLCLQNLKNQVCKDMQSCHKVWFGESLENEDETTLPSANKDIPSLKTLKLLKRTNESGCTEKLEIIEEICSEWKAMGDLMGFTPGQLKAIGRNAKDVEECCREVFSCWLDQKVKGDYPVTWKGLCELLEDMKRSDLVEEIKTFISM